MAPLVPWDLAESWDNCGLLVGDPRAEARGVLVGLDPRPGLLRAAAAAGANVAVVHHPLIFRPLEALRLDQPTGSAVALALELGVHVIACHTNFDSAASGLNAWLARELGLNGVRPLRPAAQDPGAGLGRVGGLEPALSPEDFVDLVRQRLDCPWLLEAGPRPERVRRVALCGGSGSDLAAEALAAGADCYLTAEIKHATALWAAEAGLWLLDGGHFGTEHPAMAELARQLEQAFGEQGLDLPVAMSAQQPPLVLAS